MSGEPVKTITTVRTVDATGNVISETVTTTVTETIKEPDAPLTGFYP